MLSEVAEAGDFAHSRNDARGVGISLAKSGSFMTGGNPARMRWYLESGVCLCAGEESADGKVE